MRLDPAAALTLPALVLLSALALACLLAPVAAAQQSVEPDPEPAAAAAQEVLTDGGAYAAQTLSWAGAEPVAWGDYAASAIGSPGTAPAPTDESASTMEAAGEQGAATVTFGAGSASTVAGGAAGASSNTMDQSSAPAPTLPAGDGGGDGGDGGDGSTPADDGSDGDGSAATTQHAATGDGATEETQAATAPTVPLPSAAEEPGPVTGDLKPERPGPSTPHDGAPDRVFGDGTPAEAQVASATAQAGALGSAIAAVSVFGLAAVASASTWLACRKPLA